MNKATAGPAAATSPHELRSVYFSIQANITRRVLWSLFHWRLTCQDAFDGHFRRNEGSKRRIRRTDAFVNSSPVSRLALPGAIKASFALGTAQDFGGVQGGPAFLAVVCGHLPLKCQSSPALQQLSVTCTTRSTASTRQNPMRDTPEGKDSNQARHGDERRRYDGHVSEYGV